MPTTVRAPGPAPAYSTNKMFDTRFGIASGSALIGSPRCRDVPLRNDADTPSGKRDIVPASSENGDMFAVYVAPPGTLTTATRGQPPAPRRPRGNL